MPLALCQLISRPCEQLWTSVNYFITSVFMVHCDGGDLYPQSL